MEIREQIRTVSPDLVMEPLLSLLDEATAIPLTISGSSMTPFLAPGRDTVYLSKITGPIRRGDMVLYQRHNGRYVLHRVLRVEGTSYTMVGDAQNVAEPGIRPDQLRAVVTAVRRKGRLLRKGNFWWDFFEIVWIRMVSLRLPVRNAYSIFKKLCLRGKNESK